MKWRSDASPGCRAWHPGESWSRHSSPGFGLFPQATGGVSGSSSSSSSRGSSSPVTVSVIALPAESNVWGSTAQPVTAETAGRCAVTRRTRSDSLLGSEHGGIERKNSLTRSRHARSRTISAAVSPTFSTTGTTQLADPGCQIRELRRVDRWPFLEGVVDLTSQVESGLRSTFGADESAEVASREVMTAAEDIRSVAEGCVPGLEERRRSMRRGESFPEQCPPQMLGTDRADEEGDDVVGTGPGDLCRPVPQRRDDGRVGPKAEPRREIARKARKGPGRVSTTPCGTWRSRRPTSAPISFSSSQARPCQILSLEVSRRPGRRIEVSPVSRAT